MTLKFTWPHEKEDNLNPTDDGEASEESHGASNETQLGLRLDLLVSLDVVEGGRVEVDLNQLDCWGWDLLSWGRLWGKSYSIDRIVTYETL